MNAAIVPAPHGDPLTLLVTAARALGAAEVRVAIMPAGHPAVDIQVHTAEQAAELAMRLDMPAPRLVTNERNEWWVSERGEYGFERMTIVGGHRTRCVCGGEAV